jgi:hypothetical protein
MALSATTSSAHVVVLAGELAHRLDWVLLPCDGTVSGDIAR